MTVSKRLIISASATDIGRVRAQNEDAYFLDIERGLFIVSDGIGGHQAGATASQIVVHVLPRIIEQNLAQASKVKNPPIREFLSQSIAALSQQIRQQSAGQAGLQGMGATIVAMLVRGRYAYIAHLGDSRAYLLRGRQLKQLTNDHSIVGILLRKGKITMRQAKNHPARGRISRFVGMEGDANPDVKTLMIGKSDRFLLCTDGLTSMLSDQRIAKIIAVAPDAQSACQRLINAANAAGGKDNITVVLVDC